jgi:hypothetical protein
MTDIDRSSACVLREEELPLVSPLDHAPSRGLFIAPTAVASDCITFDAFSGGSGSVL